MFLIPKSIRRMPFGKIVFRSNIKRTNGTFDWYIGGNEIRKYLDLLGVCKEDRVLILGCGNSSKVIRVVLLVEIIWIF